MKKQTIKEIKERLETIDSTEDLFFKEIELDERKGVQNAVKQWYKKMEAKNALIEQFERMSKFETEARQAGFEMIAGIDEVGRGPLAGPVVAAAVILDPKQPILGLDDSKKISEKNRNLLVKEINEKALAVSIAAATPDEIDQLNILQATKLAMSRAVTQLDIQPTFLLVDAETVNLPIKQQAIIKGDANSNSIAAASILAKVARDEMMKRYDSKYPGYDFGSNVGYGTKAHLEGLEKYGPTPIHRKTFAPVKNYLY